MTEMRAAKVEETLARVRPLIEGEVNRETLAQVRDLLAALAADASLWNGADFPPPEEGERQARYRIAQDSPEGLTLYLNVMRRGKKIVPHDHTTWACIAAVEGGETNVLWDRIDDGSQPGKAELRQRETVEVAPDRTPAIAMMPDDIHHVQIMEDDVIRHLHMYGRPLETLTRRTAFDPEAGTCKTMEIGVKTRG